jgi:oligoribonuclease
MIEKNAVPTKLLWIDLEMTGLDASKDVILEVAAEVTDFDFKPLASYAAVITQPEEKLAQMDEWCQTHHTESGLIERCRTEGRAEQEVVSGLAAFITEQFGEEPATLAGNSIHNDRRFIVACWPEIDKLLHYRMLDVSSFKILMRTKYGVEYEKVKAHRAYEDIHASIAELQYYLSGFQK